VRREHVPYICLTTTERFPRVCTASRLRVDGNRYFGPYPDAATVGALLRVLREVFDLRVDDPAAAHSSPRLPEDHSALSHLEYRAAVNGAIHFLDGETSEVERALQERMDAAAAALAFEEAARLRDLLRAIGGG
jgi:excinuclease ABC subunit C